MQQKPDENPPTCYRDVVLWATMDGVERKNICERTLGLPPQVNPLPPCSPLPPWMKRNPFGLSLALHLFTMFLGKLSLLIHLPLWVLRGAASASHCSSQSKVAILLVDDSGQVDFHAAQHSRQAATKPGRHQASIEEKSYNIIF